MTENELIYDLRSIIRNGGQLTDDDNIDDRLIAHWFKTARAALIRQEGNKYHSVDKVLISDLGCVSLEQADDAECCSDNSNCTVLRTAVEMPEFIELNDKPLITRVGPISKSTMEYSIIDAEQAPFSGNGRFNRNKVYAFYRNNRIYIKLGVDNLFGAALSKVNIRGVVADPSDLSSFATCSGTACYTADSKYPISTWMVEYLKSQILKVNVQTLLMTPSDTVNDSSGQVNTQTQTSK